MLEKGLKVLIDKNSKYVSFELVANKINECILAKKVFFRFVYKNF